MGFNCGIVGLPNVGKSTLFNALTETAAAEAANYPFTTIEPNTGRVAVPDPRLDEIGRISKSAKIVPTFLEFVDIAGLVRGASKGEGLGNQFLGNIREVDAIVHVLRCFEGEATHVEGSVDPLRDAETVETELMLADLDSVERQLETAVKRARGGEEEAKVRLAVLEPVAALLHEGRPAREVRIAKELEPIFTQLHLLTVKPVLDIANVDEDSLAAGNAYSERVARRARAEGEGFVVVSAAIEAEVAALSDPAERREFLESLGLEERLQRHIIDGEKERLEDHLEEALSKYSALDIINERYHPSLWNIYAFHCSDGDNFESDQPAAMKTAQELCDACNLFGYGEIKPLGARYAESTMIDQLEKLGKDNFQAVLIERKEDIWPSFKSFLAKDRGQNQG